MKIFVDIVSPNTFMHSNMKILGKDKTPLGRGTKERSIYAFMHYKTFCDRARRLVGWLETVVSAFKHEISFHSWR